jgi:hypothetical protein
MALPSSAKKSDDHPVQDTKFRRFYLYNLPRLIGYAGAPLVSRVKAASRDTKGTNPPIRC